MAYIVSSESETYAVTTSVTVTKPTGLAVGDLMVAQCSCIANTPTSFTPPTGWTTLSTVTAGEARQQIFYKIADSSDVAASDFSFTGTSELRAVGIYAIRDVSINSTITQTNNNISSSGTLTMSTQTPLREDCVLLLLVSGGEEATAGNYNMASPAIVTDNPTWTEDWELVDVSAGHSGTIYAASAERTEDTATGNATVELTGGGAGTYAIGHFIVINDKLAVSHATDSIEIASTVPFIIPNKPYSVGIVNTPTITTSELPTAWTNETKHSASWTNQDKS